MPKKGPSDVGFADVVMQLKVANRLLAAQLRSSMKQSDLIVLLASTGASNQEIADILGTTAPTVSNALVRTRKRGAAGQERRHTTQTIGEDE